MFLQSYYNKLSSLEADRQREVKHILKYFSKGKVFSFVFAVYEGRETQYVELIGHADYKLCFIVLHTSCLHFIQLWTE